MIATEAEQAKCATLGARFMELAIADAADGGGTRGVQGDDQNLSEIALSAWLVAMGNAKADMPGVIYGLGLILGSYAGQVAPDGRASFFACLQDGMNTGFAGQIEAFNPKGSA